MARLVLGVTGEKAGGKETFSKILQTFISPRSFALVRSSDVLRETLNLWNLPKTRRNLQEMAIAMNTHFGDQTLSNIVKSRIESTDADVVVFDGVRWPGDLEVVRSFPTNLIVYVTASVNSRYERSKARGEKSDERYSSLDKFVEEETISTETYIPTIGKTADIVIENDGTYSEFEMEVKKQFKNLIEPKLAE